MLRVATVALILLLLAAVPAVAQPLAIDASTVGEPLSGKTAELYMPGGAGPFPAVVVLHGCNGVGPNPRNWGRRLAAWGFIALVVDSLTPRGHGVICGQGRLVPAELRGQDAFAAADYLRRRADVRPERIGVIGLSHGGWTVLKAVLAGGPRPAATAPFAAAVAYYPGCEPPSGALETDTLILIGEADDWTPAARCVRWRDLVQPNGHALRLKTYPGALHAFDSGLTPPRVAFGHMIGGDPAAAADSFAETRAFFAARLAPGR